jgi:uncharacterized membrane protein
MTAAVGLALLAASAAAPVRAELNICNKTQSRVGVAIGYKEADALTTEGWWNLRPGACETVRPGPLADRYFYVHARDWEKNGTWRGSTPLCTQTKVFTIHGAGECAGRGFEEADFFEVDIGDSESWTVDLVEE